MNVFSEGYGHNDLEAAAVAQYPQVGEAVEALRRASPAARMTGSGACVFASFETERDARRALAVLPRESSLIGHERLTRSGPTVEIIHGDDLDDVEWAIEVSYEGTYELEEEVLADGSKLDQHFSSTGGWIASTLVRLGDLTFEFLPPDDPSD